MPETPIGFTYISMLQADIKTKTAHDNEPGNFHQVLCLLLEERDKAKQRLLEFEMAIEILGKKETKEISHSPIQVNFTRPVRSVSQMDDVLEVLVGEANSFTSGEAYESYKSVRKERALARATYTRMLSKLVEKGLLDSTRPGKGNIARYQKTSQFPIKKEPPDGGSSITNFASG